MTLTDNRTIYEPTGVDMDGVRGLVRRGLFVERGYGIFVITETGRAALRAREDLLLFKPRGNAV